MQPMQKIAETASNVDAVTWLTSGAVIVVITIARTAWYFWQKKKKVVTITPPVDAYMQVIAALAAEVADLKKEFETLATLKGENVSLRARVAELEAANTKQEKKINRLTTQVRNLKQQLEN